MRLAGQEIGEVCLEFGLRLMWWEFRNTMQGHRAAYEARLEGQKGGGEIGEEERGSAGLSW